MASVDIQNVTKTYAGGVRALNRVSLTIPDKRFVVLVGPSGCGKSTLLRMIAGLESISDGTIRIGDRVVNDVPPKDRDVAMVFQNYALYPHMTVRDNMAFGLRMRGVPTADARQRVEKTADLLGLGSLLDRKPRQLSGGQAQRVALGRAIVRQPAVFLFDEPLSNLDAQHRAMMRRELVELHRRLQTTMILVTHDQVEAMTLGEEIVVLHAGEIQQVGPPRIVYDHPANQFVAGFVGTPSMNFLTGTIDAVGSALRLRLSDWTIPLPRNVATGTLTDRASVTLGIRPEAFTLGGTSPETLMTPQVTIDDVQHLGNELLTFFRLANTDCVARLDARSPIERAQPVTLQIDPTRIHLFDSLGRNVAPEPLQTR